ncbi:MAG: hypothetical protein ACI85V_002695 [bacterium]
MGINAMSIYGVVASPFQDRPACDLWAITPSE